MKMEESFSSEAPPPAGAAAAASKRQLATSNSSMRGALDSEMQGDEEASHPRGYSKYEDEDDDESDDIDDDIDDDQDPEHGHLLQPAGAEGHKRPRRKNTMQQQQQQQRQGTQSPTSPPPKPSPISVFMGTLDIEAAISNIASSSSAAASTASPLSGGKAHSAELSLKKKLALNRAAARKKKKGVLLKDLQRAKLLDKNYSPSKLKRPIGIGDKVLCQNGERAYEAFILEIKMLPGRPKGSSTTARARYKVHYHGWNKRYDEWIQGRKVLQLLVRAEDLDDNKQ